MGRKSKKRKKDKHKAKKAVLNEKLARRRRPTMIDLETRGIVPSGYFDDVEVAMHSKKIQKDNIIKDLTNRLESRPEFSENLAKGLMSKAIDSLSKRHQMVESGKNENDKKMISQILTAKLADRMDHNELKQK